MNIHDIISRENISPADILDEIVSVYKYHTTKSYYHAKYDNTRSMWNEHLMAQGVQLILSRWLTQEELTEIVEECMKNAEECFENDKRRNEK